MTDQLLTEREMNAQQIESDTSIEEAVAGLDYAKGAFTTHYGGREPHDPTEAQRWRFEQLDSAERTALGVIARVNGFHRSALRQIEALNPASPPDDATLKRISGIEPAIQSQAAAASIGELTRLLQDAVYSGDATICKLWARHAEAAIDRGDDSGLRGKGYEIQRVRGLIAQAGSMDAPPDRRAALRQPHIDALERSMALENEIVGARRARNAPAIGNDHRFGAGDRRTRWPDKISSIPTVSGYETIDDEVHAWRLANS